MKIRKVSNGINNHDYAQGLHNMGLIYFANSAYQHAQPYFEKAFKIRAALLGESNMQTQASLKLANECERIIRERQQRRANSFIKSNSSLYSSKLDSISKILY